MAGKILGKKCNNVCHRPHRERRIRGSRRRAHGVVLFELFRGESISETIWCRLEAQPQIFAKLIALAVRERERGRENGIVRRAVAALRVAACSMFVLQAPVSPSSSRSALSFTWAAFFQEINGQAISLGRMMTLYETLRAEGGIRF